MGFFMLSAFTLLLEKPTFALFVPIFFTNDKIYTRLFLTKLQLLLVYIRKKKSRPGNPQFWEKGYAGARFRAGFKNREG